MVLVTARCTCAACGCVTSRVKSTCRRPGVDTFRGLRDKNLKHAARGVSLPMRAPGADLSQEGAPRWPGPVQAPLTAVLFAEALLDPRHRILNPQRPLWLLLWCEEHGIEPWSNLLTACSATKPLNPHVRNLTQQLQLK